jgi:hypothetical protein
MIASEFRSQVRPLKSVTCTVGNAIGDSVLYHSLLWLASGEGFMCADCLPFESPAW